MLEADLDRLWVPYYLQMMRWRELRDGDPFLDEICALAREVSVANLRRLLLSHWRPRLMGAWFATARDEVEIGDAVLVSLATCGGSLTSPWLVTAALIHGRPNTMHTLLYYAERDRANGWGAAGFALAGVELLGGKATGGIVTDADRGTLTESMDFALRLRSLAALDNHPCIKHYALSSARSARVGPEVDVESRRREASVATFDGLLAIAPLPNDVVNLLESVIAPPLLCAHLRLVHDVAIQITRWMRATWPEVQFDADLVAFGAATHDIGKTLHPRELSAAGSAHELSGQALLIDLGVSADRARFAVTHNEWTSAAVTTEDLLVAVADKIWKGKRDDGLEALLIELVCTKTGLLAWEVFALLDEELDRIAASANDRLAFQAQWANV